MSEDIEIVLTSRPHERLDATQLHTARRGHWTIETVHYVRDVSFDEDPSTIRTGHGPRNMASLRNLIIGLCALDGARRGKRASFMPVFRRRAQNGRSFAIDLVARPLIEAD